MHQQQTTETAFHHRREMAEDHLWYKGDRHSSIYQKLPVSEPIPLHLFVLHSPLVLLVELHRLGFLDATHSSPLEITKHNEEQHIKDYSS